VPPPPKGTQATHVDLDGVKAVAVVTPASHGGRLVLYLHGGGHVSGSPALYGDFTWRIAAATRARTVILDHRLAPEHPFPAALDDAVTAYRALVTDGADPRRMAVLGESSGGGLVLAMLLCVKKAFICRPPPSRFRPGPISRSPAIPCSETPRPIRCCEARRARGSRAARWRDGRGV
jgi:epsilon-lactone hydrolase